MAKDKLTLSVDNAAELKDAASTIGEWFVKTGQAERADIWDAKHGKISASSVIELLIARQLREIESE